MLDLLRKKAQSPFIQGTILIIALVFIFWGAGSSYRGSRNNVATVNDERISYETFQKAYEQLTNQYRQQFGGNIPKELQETLDLEGQTVEQLIQRTLLRQGARQMGIMVSDLEVQKAIENMEAFRTNGIFNVEQYQKIITSSGMTPASFEEAMRTDLLAGKTIDHLSRFAALTPLEVSEQFDFDNEQINIEYVSFSSADFTESIKPDEDELLSYYDENKDSYMTEPQVKLHFLLFPFDSEDKPDVGEAEVESFYNLNRDRYSAPEKRKARHILIKTAEGDSEEALSKKRERAGQVLELAKSGEDFAELAKQYSEGPSGPGGGDLGTFSRGRMVRPFEDTAFALKEGEISDIVETQFGYHVIKVEKIEPARTKPLAEVRDSIVKEIQKQKASELAFNKATEAYEKIILAGSLDKFSQQHTDIPVEETDFFPRKSPEKSGASEGMLTEPAFLNTAFSLKKGELSSLVETPKGYAIIFAADRKEPETAPFEDVAEQVRQDYIRKKSDTLAQDTAESMLEALKENGDSDFASESAKHDKTPANSGYISRNMAGDSSLPAQLVNTGFELPPQSPYPEKIITANGQYYVFRVLERKPPTPELFSKKENEFRTEMLERKKATILAAWLANFRAKSEIEINEQFL
jgi:peptidyl-prolyl cis-trans isomerase D